ncbi:MAG: hypothetical protein Q8Q14_03060 [Gemmatimonadales bacterium]|nr:hypothetical protein [Gemmatimonadales bacterium]
MSYTIEHHPHGMSVCGAVDLGDFTHLGALAADRGYDQMAPGLASALGVSLVFGSVESLRRWRREIEARAGAGLAGWLAGGDTGLSSLALVAHLAGGEMRAVARARGGGIGSYPHDGDDLGRCLRLLDVAPELRERLPSMAGVSPAWAALVSRWDEMEALYREEEPSGRTPMTYAMISGLLADGGP